MADLVGTQIVGFLMYRLNYPFLAAVFTLVSLLVIGIATVCLVQLHTRLFDRFLPDTSRLESWGEEEVDEHLALQTVREFKFRYIFSKI